jgi:hypothetical protein
MTNLIDPELRALMTQTIVIQNPAPLVWNAVPNASPTPALDAYGRHANPLPNGDANSSQAAWGNPVTYKCRLEYNEVVVKGADNRDRVSRGRAYLDGFYPEVQTTSRATVPDQVQPAMQHPVILKVESNYDENGLNGYNTIVHFE